MNKNLLKKVAKEAVYVLLQIVLSKINLFGFFSPAGLPFAFLRLEYGGNIFVILAAFIVSKIYTFTTLSGLLITVYEVVFLALFYFAKEFLKVKHKWLLTLIFAMLSNVLYLYYSLSSLTALWHFAVSFLSQTLLVFYFYKFFSVCKNKRVFFKLSSIDYLVFSVITLLFSVGIFSFSFIANYLGIFVLICPIIFMCKILPTEKYFMASITLSLGSFIATNNSSLFIFAVIFSVLILEFKSISKYIFTFISAAILTIFTFIFKFLDVFSIISMCFAVLLFLALPQKIMSKLICLFEEDALSLAANDLESQKILDIKQRLMLMSGTLYSMQNDFKYLLIGKIDREKAGIELAGDIINKCCSSCENFKSCFFGNINKRAHFESLLIRAIEHGSVEAQDMSNGMLAYCSKSGVVISEINQTAKMFLSYESAMKTEDTSKLLISNELGNFADIFANFSSCLGSPLHINERLSKVLKERLISGMIDAKEVVIAENENGIERINAVLVNEQVMHKEVSDIITKVTKNKVKMLSVKHLEFSGLSLASFMPLPALRACFCVSSKAKENQNGDSNIITKLSENKYFVAIADGMGHGEGANKISTMVLSLIKSMFQVGLDEGLILQSVNKLLLPAGLDNFTTLDACVIDLDNQVCTFIKLGSSVSVVKHKNTAEVVSCKSLPIGVVQNIKPTIIKKQISAGDIIFLASDGVVDSFAGIEQFKCFINDSKIYNLQKYLDDVVGDAEVQNVKHPDDMTIIGINLLKN